MKTDEKIQERFIGALEVISSALENQEIELGECLMGEITAGVTAEVLEEITVAAEALRLMALTVQGLTPDKVVSFDFVSAVSQLKSTVPPPVKKERKRRVRVQNKDR